MLQPMDYSTKEEFINDQYEKLSETGKTKFRMKVAKKSIDLDRALYLWSFFGWFGFHQLYLKNYGAYGDGILETTRKWNEAQREDKNV